MATVIGLAVLLAAALVPGPARAGHAGVFELDGNMADSPSGAPWDWTTFFDSAGARITPLPETSSTPGSTVTTPSRT